MRTVLLIYAVLAQLKYLERLSRMDLEKALEQFDLAEANLHRLEKIWDEAKETTPEFIQFTGGDGRYEELLQGYRAIKDVLPAIGGYRPSSMPMQLNEIAQDRLDAREVSEISASILVEEVVSKPGMEIAEYRRRLGQARRALIRDRMQTLIADVESLLIGLTERVEANREPIIDLQWHTFKYAIDQVERLAGSQIPRKSRWGDLHRHMAWAQGVDIHDIARLDWPAVRREIESSLYSELEPLPMEVEDLATLVAARPTGPVTTKLNWSSVDAEGLERLIFNLVADAPGYTNPQWLMHTSAPDRGRDISVERIITDSLAGTKHQRVIIQVKHWLSRSLSATDISDAASQIPLWEPPAVHTLIIATSGRFTESAVTWVEKHNFAGKLPNIEMWPDSHLELVLAERPRLAAEYKLR